MQIFSDLRRNETMLLQTVRPNIVQSIRAYRVEDLMQAAQDAGQHRGRQIWGMPTPSSGGVASFWPISEAASWVESCKAC